MQDASELRENPQYDHREYFREVSHPVAGTAEMPGPPLNMEGTPWAVNSPAPTLGQHNREVYCDELGLSADELAQPLGRGGGVMTRMALEGVRIVEFGQLIAIPFATKLLADMGAEVMRIESCTRLDGYRVAGFYKNDASGEFWNRAVNFYEQNRNKKSLTLDLAQERARETLRDLVAVSDVFAENFTPRVIRNFGLEYEDLRRIRPDIIMVSSTGYGHTGPWSGFGAIGYGTEAASGLASVTGYRDGPPTIPELPYADYTAGEHTVFAIMAALAHRAMTGQGQFIDISQTQTLSATVPEPLMDYTFNGHIRGRAGNRDDIYAPQGTYPCAGEDSWISISIRSEGEWASLCEILNRPDWMSDPRFASHTSRSDNHDDLDEMLAQVTSSWDARELEAALSVARGSRRRGAGRQGPALRRSPERARLLRGGGASGWHEYAAAALRKPPLEVRQDARLNPSCRAHAGRAQFGSIAGHPGDVGVRQGSDGGGGDYRHRARASAGYKPALQRIAPGAG